MRKFLFAIVAASALLFAACDDKDKDILPDDDGDENVDPTPGGDPTEDPTNAAKVLVYAAEYDSARDEWKMNSDGTQHIFTEEAVATVYMIWNQWDNCHESYVKFETENYDGDVEVAGPDWLEFYELEAEAGVIKLVSDKAPIEGAEGTIVFTGDNGATELGTVGIVALSINAPFTVVFPTPSDTVITTLHFDYNGNFNMGTEEAPIWSEASAYGNLVAAAEGDNLPKVFILSKSGDALSADDVDWVYFSYAGEETRSTLVEKRIIVSVDAQAENSIEREAYIIFLPFDTDVKEAKTLLSGAGIAGEYKNYPQFPIKQNAWRSILPFELRNDAAPFQSLSEYTPAGAYEWAGQENYYKLTYTEYTVDANGEADFPAPIQLNFTFEKFELYNSRGNDAAAYYTWTAESAEGEMNWLQVRQAAQSNPYLWQIAMTGESTIADEVDPTYGYILFYEKAADEAPYAILKCKYGLEEDRVPGGETPELSLYEAAGDWAVEQLEAGNDLYEAYKDALTAANGTIFLVHHNGSVPAEIPTNVKLAGVPATNEKYGDIIMTWLGGAEGLYHDKWCEWVLHEGEEQEAGYPNISTGYVEFEVNTKAMDVSTGYAYAVSQHSNSNFECDMVIIVEMTWDVPEVNVSLYEPAGKWAVEEAGVELYDIYKESLTAADGKIFLIHHNDVLPAEIPTNVKLAGVPASNEYGDIMMTWLSGGEGLYHDKWCEWVLHAGEEQEAGYPQESTGYVEFEVNTKAMDVSTGYAYAVSQHFNSKNECDILFVVEMTWDVPEVNVSLIEPEGKWEIEKLAAGNELYDAYKESLTAADGKIFLVHHNGVLPAEIPTNVKLAGIPATNEYGDIIMSWLGGGEGVYHDKWCEWVLHAGEEQDAGYPQESTGYVEFEVNTKDMDVSTGYAYAVSQHFNSKNECDILIVVEMTWDVPGGDKISLYEPAGAWTIEEAGVELYDIYKNSLTAADGEIVLVHYNGALADMPTNVKLKGVPRSNSWGDIIMSWLGPGEGLFHEKSCEWVLHAGEEQEAGYPQESTGYVEFEVLLNDIDTTKGYSYAVSQHFNDNNECDILFVIEMLWE